MNLLTNGDFSAVSDQTNYSSDDANVWKPAGTGFKNVWLARTWSGGATQKAEYFATGGNPGGYIRTSGGSGVNCFQAIDAPADGAEITFAFDYKEPLNYDLAWMEIWLGTTASADLDKFSGDFGTGWTRLLITADISATSSWQSHSVSAVISGAYDHLIVSSESKHDMDNVSLTVASGNRRRRLLMGAG